MRRLIHFCFFFALPFALMAQRHDVSLTSYYADGKVLGDRQMVSRASYLQRWPNGIYTQAGVSTMWDINGRVKKYSGIVTSLGYSGTFAQEKITWQGGVIIGNEKNCWEYGFSAALGRQWPGRIKGVFVEAQQVWFKDVGFVPVFLIGAGVEVVIKK